MTTTSTPDIDTDADTTAGLTDGYHLVVEALKLNDVHTIYGVVGIPITDVARVAQASGIRYIGFRHESDAGHAAAAAGFLTKKPGVCLTVSAPGFLNGLVALANATTNCFPMVQISGSSERHLVDLKQGDYEELDQLAAAEPFAKAAYRVNRVEDIGRGIARAIRTGRFWWIVLGYFLALVAWYVVQVHQTKYLIDVGFSPLVAAWALCLSPKKRGPAAP